jgi:hypothetical protein
MKDCFAAFLERADARPVEINIAGCTLESKTARPRVARTGRMTGARGASVGEIRADSHPTKAGPLVEAGRHRCTNDIEVGEPTKAKTPAVTVDADDFFGLGRGYRLGPQMAADSTRVGKRTTGRYNRDGRDSGRTCENSGHIQFRHGSSPGLLLWGEDRPCTT